MELKCELIMSNKTFPSAPARARSSHDSSIESPLACPSLTGAVENSSFSSPPVPALQRKLLRLSLQGRPRSGLKSEVRFEASADENLETKGDSTEFLKETRLSRGHVEGDTSWNGLADADLESIVFKKRASHPPPAFDPDATLGDISINEDIYEDATRAGAYLDSLENVSEATQKSSPHEMKYLDESASSSQDESSAAHPEVTVFELEVSRPTSQMVDADVQTEGESEVVSKDIALSALMVDVTTQTETDVKVFSDVGVQVTQIGELIGD